MTTASLTQLTADKAHLNIYTDGSYASGTGIVAQAGIFIPHLQTGYPMTFNGDQNAQFAERIGLAGGVSMTHNLYFTPETIQPGCRHAFADVTNIYTDNLGNLQLFKRWINNPHSMRFHPHRALFEALAETASLLPCKLRIRKVVSHTGLHYNEAADATALNPSPDSQDPLEAMGYTRA